MRLFPVSLILLLSWAALAFGGSPTWAGASVLVLAITTGVLGFLESRSSQTVSEIRRGVAVPFSIALVLTAVSIQIVPLSPGVVRKLSPARQTVNYERLLAAADRRIPPPDSPDQPQQPLSIVSARTELGLAGLVGLSVLLMGASRAFSVTGTRRVAMAISVLGVVVALIGLYQLTVTARLVYGWYVPLFVNAKSAPFLNPNHQAGWLVMVISLTLGAFAGEVARGQRGVEQWRQRILWLSSKEASQAVLMIFAAGAIGVGVLATGARSGVIALILTFVAVAWWSGRRQPTRLRKLALGVGLLILGFSVVVFNGQAVLLELISTTGPGDRLDLWRDTIRMAGDYWLTGTGFNTYGAAMLHYQSLKDGFRYVEAHNEYLQLAAEGGLLVGIPFLILAATLIREIRLRFREALDDTRTYWIRVGAVTGMIVMALQSIVEFTLQMPGGAVMFTTLLAIAIHHPPPREARRRASE